MAVAIIVVLTFLRPRSRDGMQNPAKSGLPTKRSAQAPNRATAAPRLTGTERRILDFMLSYLRANTYQPSIREICIEVGIKSTKSVSEHLRSMADKGYLERSSYRSRGIRITGVDLQTRALSLPCYLRLSELPEAEGEGESDLRIAVDRRWAEAEGSFMVQAGPGWLKATGVEEGDFLVIRPVEDDDLADGDIVVARWNGFSAFWQVEMEGSEVSLLPLDETARAQATPAASPDPIRPVVTGKVSALYRSLGGPRSSVPQAAH